jgi:hypothetical protein
MPRSGINAKHLRCGFFSSRYLPRPLSPPKAAFPLMKYTKEQKWERFQKYNFEFPSVGLAVDLSRMNVDDAFFAKFEPQLQKAYAAMSALEGGAIANPDENRMVGHYWLRKAELAPAPGIRQEIENNLKNINEFAAKVHAGQVGGAGGKFKKLSAGGHRRFRARPAVRGECARRSAHR